MTRLVLTATAVLMTLLVWATSPPTAPPPASPRPHPAESRLCFPPDTEGVEGFPMCADNMPTERTA